LISGAAAAELKLAAHSNAVAATIVCALIFSLPFKEDAA
jgi:hypothetical protein